MTSNKDKEKELLFITNFIESQKMSDIIKKAKDFELKTIKPTKDVISKAYNILYEFLRSKQRVIYGGTSISILLQQKNYDEVYSDNEFPDIDFLTPEPYEDALEISNRLYAAGIQYINVTEALKENTFKVFIEHSRDELADISYIPPSIYTYIFKHASSNCTLKGTPMKGLKIINPNFQIIDTLNVLISPALSWLKVAKNLKREVLLSNHYMIPVTDVSGQSKLSYKFRKTASKTIQNMRRFINLNVIDSIGCGNNAYEYYNRQVSGWKQRTIKNMPLEYYTINAHDISKKLFARLKKEFPNKELKYVEYYPYLGQLNSRYIIFSGKKWIAVFCDYKDQCTSVKQIKNKRILTYWGTLRYCYIMYHRCRIDGFSSRAIVYQYMYKQLRYIYRTWCVNKTVEERTKNTSPFQILEPICIPTKNLENVTRKARIKKANERNKNTPGMGKFTYRPNEKVFKEIKYNKKTKKYRLGPHTIEPFPNLTGLQKERL